MMTEPARYAFVELDREGLLLDLASGSLFHLNESAAMVWARSLAGAPAAAIAEALATRYQLAAATARDHVAGALTLDPTAAETNPLSGPYLYERSSGGYTLSRDDIPLLEIQERGQSVALSRSDSVASRDLPMVLQAVAPKLMSLRGHFVLHASAVVLGGAIVAFCGKSGAGKTTTARALVRAGATPVCEDKLVVRWAGAGLQGLIRGERDIMEWVATAAARMSGGQEASCAGLDGVTGGESLPIGELAFLDVSRRSGASIAALPLTHVQAARAMFGNSFHGSDVPDDWRRQLDTAAAAARVVPAYELTAPAGLPALESAARDAVARGTIVQTAMTAS